MLGFNSQRVPLKLGCMDFSVMPSLQHCSFMDLLLLQQAFVVMQSPYVTHLQVTQTELIQKIATFKGKTETEAINFFGCYSRFKSEFYFDFCRSCVKSFP